MARPRLVIIAGCNGCGKTSLTKVLKDHPWTDGCYFINPDYFARDMFGGWHKESSFVEAQKYATDLTYELIAQGKSILLETAFSSERKLELVDRAKKAGYFIRVYFIGTDDPTINAARVCRRMMDGGHEVYLRDIIKRHGNAEKMCVRAAPLVDRLYVFDNSANNKNPVELFRVRNGFLVDQKISEAILDHEWSMELLKGVAESLHVVQEVHLSDTVTVTDHAVVSVLHQGEVVDTMVVSDRMDASIIKAGDTAKRQ